MKGLLFCSALVCAWAGVAEPVLMPAVRELKEIADVYRLREPMPCVWYDWADYDVKGACLAKANYVMSRDASLPPEGYELAVTPGRIAIVAADDAGEFYARETLKQLTTQVSTDTVEVACCEIRDWPQFRWRGLLIDEARHFLGKSVVKRTLDLMAMHKMNVLHWHLVDDQGWRLELKRHPELVEYGSVRPCSVKMGALPRWLPPEKKLSYEHDTEKYGPFFYTQADVKEILAYAKSRHVTVVPEIELPGHVRAFLAAHPELSCKGDLPRVPRVNWSIEEDVLCVGNDAGIKLLEEIFDEVCELFPDTPYIHIGGDECPRVRWETCPKCQARMKALGLKDESGLQTWVTSHFVRYLEKKGRRAVGWDEILAGDVPQSTIGMTWRMSSAGGAGSHFVSAAEATARGHDMVMTPSALCYLSQHQFKKGDAYPYYGVLTGEPLTLEKVYAFDPVDGIPEKDRSHVIGGQACVWGEAVHNVYDLEWKAWPRACAIAEALWTAPADRDFSAFRRRVAAHRDRLVSAGYNVAPLAIGSSDLFERISAAMPCPKGKPSSGICTRGLTSRPVKAVQLDLARQTETVSFIKSFTDRVAEAGYNTLVLYLEGRVRTPSFSMGEGESYSSDDMREIVDHATSRGVDVVPVVSVLGHAEHFFTKPGLDHLAEERGGVFRWPVSSKETFCVTQPDARRFLENYLKEIAEIFPGKNLHLGLDESWQFGFCDSCRARREEVGFGPLFTEYVTWAEGVCKRLGKRMWMWDDMYEFFHDELEKAPRDIVMCHWIYDDDVTEWGHRGHFLNRIRKDWLAEYEKLGLDALPVSAACPDNIRTLGAYAARHRTRGTYVAQWELTDSFYGVPISILIGVDRAFPSLNAVERSAVEALASTWSYFRSNGGVSLSRSRWKGRVSADATLNASEPAAVRMALAVLKGAKSHPGSGEVASDPLSEEALLDDVFTQFEQILFRYELDELSVPLSTPRRTAAESQSAKAKLRALVPEMKRVLARKEEQERTWRPDRRPNNMTAPMRDNLDYAEKLLSVPDVAADSDWILGLSLSLPDFHGIPQWKVSGLFSDGWREIACGCWKPMRGNWANFEKKIAFSSAEAPQALRIEESGYGEGLLLHVSVWNRNRRLIPLSVTRVEGIVIDPANILKDDWRPVRFGLQDRAQIFVNPNLSKMSSALECAMIDL